MYMSRYIHTCERYMGQCIHMYTVYMITYNICIYYTSRYEWLKNLSTRKGHGQSGFSPITGEI